MSILQGDFPPRPLIWFWNEWGGWQYFNIKIPLGRYFDLPSKLWMSCWFSFYDSNEGCIDFLVTIVNGKSINSKASISKLFLHAQQQGEPTAFIQCSAGSVSPIQGVSGYTHKYDWRVSKTGFIHTKLLWLLCVRLLLILKLHKLY